MSWGLALVALVSFCAFGQEYKPSFDRYLYRFENNQLVENGVFLERVPRFAEIKQAQSRIQTYEQFLDYLFAEAPSLKKHFVLLHHSQSLQFASPEFPRTILFDGGVAFAISEHPENRLRKVEMMEVDPVSREINMREITFRENGVHFDERPNTCTTCHGLPVKPLWDPYDFWPNAYGAFSGSFVTQQEQDGYTRLRQNASASPLLSRLELQPSLDLNNEEINGLTYFLTQIGYTKFWKSLGRGFEQNGFRLPLLAVLNHCVTGNLGTPFETEKAELLKYFQPGSLSASDLQRLDQIYADIVASRAFTKNFQNKLVAQYFLNPNFISTVDHARLESERVPLALIRWLLDLSGVNAANMSLSLMANDYLLSSPSNFLLDLLTSLYEARSEYFVGLTVGSQDIGFGKPAWLKLSCDEIKAQSLTVPRTVAQSKWRSYLAVQPERPVLSRCTKCHTESLSAAPRIEFEDSLVLARRLRTSDLADKIISRIQATDARQMPPGNPLSAAEIAGMKEYLQSLR